MLDHSNFTAQVCERLISLHYSFLHIVNAIIFFPFNFTLFFTDECCTMLINMITVF